MTTKDTTEIITDNLALEMELEAEGFWAEDLSNLFISQPMELWVQDIRVIESVTEDIMKV